MHLSRRSLFCLPFSLVLNAAEGDSAVILAMRRAYPDLKERRIWHRVRVTNDFDVVLILPLRSYTRPLMPGALGRAMTLCWVSFFSRLPIRISCIRSPRSWGRKAGSRFPCHNQVTRDTSPLVLGVFKPDTCEITRK